MRAAGIDVIALSSGEPDFPTPPHVCDAAYAAMQRGETTYPPLEGTPALKAAIIAKFERENGLTFKPAEIIVSNGAKQVLFNAFMATLAPGDEVILPTPCWVSYLDMTKLAEGVPVEVPCPQNNGFKLRPEDLEAAITPRTRWLVLNAPGNPGGAVYTHEELAALADVLRRHAHVGVMTDDIYEHIIFDGLKFHSFGAVAPDLLDRTLTINGVSKAYAMTGWRIGYAAGPAHLIRAMAKLQAPKHRRRLLHRPGRRPRRPHRPARLHPPTRRRIPAPPRRHHRPPRKNPPASPASAPRAPSTSS